MRRVKVKEHKAKRVLLLLLSFMVFISTVMANIRYEEEQTKETDKGNMKIVYMDRVVGKDDPIVTHIKTLAAIFGSEKEPRLGLEMILCTKVQHSLH